jgi:hypothetical protein
MCVGPCPDRRSLSRHERAATRYLRWQVAVGQPRFRFEVTTDIRTEAQWDSQPVPHADQEPTRGCSREQLTVPSEPGLMVLARAITMALPTAYLTSFKNVEALFTALQQAKAPPKFTQRFLEDLGFKSTADRLYINVLKALGLLSPDGAPTPRYYEFLDQSQSGRVLAEALEETYADLFQLRRDAQNMERAELRGKFKTLTQGQVSDNVVNAMAGTFQALAKLADFGAPRAQRDDDRFGGAGDGAGRSNDVGDGDPGEDGAPQKLPGAAGGIRLGGFVYNVELHLPESRDPAVYEALFRALKTHLLS